MSQKKRKKNVVVDSKEFLAGIQALTIYYERKVQEYTQVKMQLNDERINESMLEDLEILGDVLNHLTTLVGDQLKNEGDSLN